MLKNIIKDGRYRNASLTTLMNMLSQAIIVITGLVSIPVILNYVGTEQFALWMVLTTALSFIAFSDFGIGIGVQDSISKYFAKEESEGVRKIFSTSLLILSTISIVIVGFLFSFFYIKNFENIYYSVGLVFSLGIVAGLIVRIFYAIQKGFVIALIQLVSRIISFLSLFVCVYYKIDFSVIVFFVGGTAYLFILVFGIPYLYKEYPQCFRFSIGSIDFYLFKSVLNVGILGLGASIAIYMINNTLPYLLSLKYSASVVASFSIAYKVISLPIMILGFVFVPLWPAITEASVKNDHQWILKVVGKMKLIFITFSVIFSFFIYFFIQDVIDIWVKNNLIFIDNKMLVLMIFFMVLSFWNSYLTSILNGFSLYKSQAVWGLFISVITFLIAYTSLFVLSYEYYYLIFIILIGYFFRCLYMFFEVRLRLSVR